MDLCDHQPSFISWLCASDGYAPGDHEHSGRDFFHGQGLHCNSVCRNTCKCSLQLFRQCDESNGRFQTSLLLSPVFQCGECDPGLCPYYVFSYGRRGSGRSYSVQPVCQRRLECMVDVPAYGYDTGKKDTDEVFFTPCETSLCSRAAYGI